MPPPIIAKTHGERGTLDAAIVDLLQRHRQVIGAAY